MSKSYRPDKHSTKSGDELFILGFILFCGGLYSFFYMDFYYWFVLVFIGVFLFLFSFSRFKVGKARFHGIEFEKTITQNFRPKNDWGYFPDVENSNIGNVDILLKSPSKKTYTVEIKSYYKLSKGRMWVIDQCLKQKQEYKSIPVLWLPKAKSKYKSLDYVPVISGVYVIYGDENYLWEFLEDIDYGYCYE